MNTARIKAAIQGTYGDKAVVNAINECFADGWYKCGRRYNSFRALAMGLRGLTDCSMVNLSITDGFGVGHNADFAMAEFK
jgi:hypothetical protein